MQSNPHLTFTRETFLLLPPTSTSSFSVFGEANLFPVTLTVVDLHTLHSSNKLRQTSEVAPFATSSLFFLEPPSAFPSSPHTPVSTANRCQLLVTFEAQAEILD